MKTITSILLTFSLLSCSAQTSEQLGSKENLNFIAEELLYHVKINDTLKVDSLVLVLEKLAKTTLENSLENDNQKKAFWLNIYNAYIQKILSKNPEKYQDRNQFFKAEQINIAGHLFSFDFIEHGILRRSKSKLSLGYFNKWFPSALEKKLRVDTLDYRIHFALNCGASSCPAVAYYIVSELDNQLAFAEETFILANTEINTENKSVKTSKIFSWFRADFGGKKGIKKLISKHTKQDLNDFKLTFAEYDWNLALENYKPI